DRLVDGMLEPSSPYRAELKNRRLDHLVAAQYPDELSAFRAGDDMRGGSIDQWCSRLAAHLDSQIKFYSPRMLSSVCFSLRFRDLPGEHWLNIRWNGARFEVAKSARPSSTSVANIETTTAVIETSIDNDWGGDVLTIGYACDIHIVD